MAEHLKPLAWATIYSQRGREDMVEVGAANPERERQAETWGWSHRRVPLVEIPADQMLVPKELLARAEESLRSEIEAHYSGTKDHPAIHPKYLRDIAEADDLRAILNAATKA